MSLGRRKRAFGCVAGRAQHPARHGTAGRPGAAEPTPLRPRAHVVIGLGLVWTRTSCPRSCTGRPGSLSDPKWVVHRKTNGRGVEHGALRSGGGGRRHGGGWGVGSHKLFVDGSHQLLRKCLHFRAKVCRSRAERWLQQVVMLRRRGRVVTRLSAGLWL